MTKLPMAEEMSTRWVKGMLETLPISCPICGRKTMSDWRCQWCKSQWNTEQIEQVRKQRKELVENIRFQ